MIEITKLGEGWPEIEWLLNNKEFSGDEFLCCGRKITIVAGTYSGGDIPHTALIDGADTGIYEPGWMDAAQTAIDTIYNQRNR